MRAKLSILPILILFLIAALTVSCDRNLNPLGSKVSQTKDSTNAVLTGTVNLGTSQITNFSSINLGIKGTNLNTTPDEKGDFILKNIPSGDIVLEVIVQTDLTEISIENVKSDDIIEVVIEILAGNGAALVQLNRSDGDGEDGEVDLALEIRPDRWNIAWAEDEDFSEDEVIAKISGEGFDRIDPDSVVMIEPDGDEIEPYEYDLGDVFFIAKFYQYEAISIIPDPTRGDSHTITVLVIVDEEEISLEAVITIVGKKSAGELSLAIRPDRWNTAWSNSEGVVLAVITGEGFDDIDCSSVEMSASGPTIEPSDCNLNEAQFMAKFNHKDIVTLIPTDAKRGDSFSVTVTGEIKGEDSFSLTCNITIVN